MWSKATFGFFLLLSIALLHHVSADCLWEEKGIIIMIMILIIIIIITLMIIMIITLMIILKQKHRRKACLLQGLMVGTGEITGFDLAKKKVEICTKKGEFNDIMMKFCKEKMMRKHLTIVFVLLCICISIRFLYLYCICICRRVEVPQREEGEEASENCLQWLVRCTFN